MVDDHHDKDMTLEERLAWLRDRGIQVTTPEERKVSQMANVMRQADTVSNAEVSYVLIPADTSKPLQELNFRPDTLPGDRLVEHLKPAFAREAQSVDIGLLQQQATQTLAASPDTPSTVSDATLRQVASEANVETFHLVHASATNQYTDVVIYLDEVGMLKRLSLNTRASKYAYLAGFNPAPQFYGDIFIGRLQRKPTLRHKSFVLGIDTAPDAPWLQAATLENLQRQMELNRMTGRSDTQLAVAGDGQMKQEDGFSWVQTEEELEVVIPLPVKTQSKDVNVVFRPESLKATSFGKDLVMVPLFERVDVDGCTWTLESNDECRKLVVTMEKVESAFWPRIKD
jgi:hypothetical protein